MNNLILYILASLIGVLIFATLLNAWLQKRDEKRFSKLSTRDKIIEKLSKNPSDYKNFINEEKGIAYEFSVGEYYESLGYKVNFNGIEKGINDGGIDLIATKKLKIDEKSYKTQTLLIQCKNYNNTNRLDQDVVRKFLGDCYIYLHSKKLLNKHNTARHIFCISNPLDNDHSILRYEKFCNNHRNFDLQIQTIPYNIDITQNQRLQKILQVHVYSKYDDMIKSLH